MSHHLINKPELLAPVGSPDALLAAVRCGADAVYLGAGRFHARQHASPFDDDTLRKAIAYCHAHGVAVHITLNTLIHESEFNAALADAERAAALGVDALIIQDRGLAAAVHRAAPDLPLHASTQLSCHTPAGVRKLQEDGFSRVVLAREMTAEEIAACTRVGCEIETFVHGALCMSVSGQCLLSAMLGGRSGNRGQCAQPCRLPFSLYGNPKEADRALSLKDGSLVAHIDRLAAIGVRSLKIEGRMKRPEYVAASVAVFRAALDGKDPDPTLAEDLKSIFSRSGFTDGYFTGRRTMAMFGSRTKEDVTAAPAAIKRLSNLYHKETAHVPLTLSLSMHPDTPAVLTLTDHDGHTVTVNGEIPRIGDTPLSEERLQGALAKFGGTPFYAEHITVERDPALDLPLSALNALRRDATVRLRTLREAPAPIAFSNTPAPVYPAVAVPDTPALVVRLATAAQWSEALARIADLTVLPLATDASVWQTCLRHGRVAVEVPRGLFGAEKTLLTALAAAKDCGVQIAICHTTDAVAYVKAAGLVPFGGFGLHTVNTETLRIHKADGLCAATLSPELRGSRLRFAEATPLPVGVMAYGRLPLMLLRNCPASAAKGCRDCKQNRTLTDRKGVVFPLMCAYGCADLLNSVPLYTADRPERFPRVSFLTLYMTTESADEVTRMTELYDRARRGNGTPSAIACPDGHTTGMQDWV